MIVKIKKISAEYFTWIALLIFLVSLVTRLAMFQAIGPLMQDDSGQYLATAENIVTYQAVLEQDGFTGELRPQTLRTPGYPLFIAFFYQIFGVGETALNTAVVAQILLVSGMSVVVAYTGRRFMSAEIGILAAAICALDPWLSYAALTVLNEALFSVFFVSSFLIGAIALQKQNWQWAFLWGLFLGLATLVRPVTQHHFVIPILLFALLPVAVSHKLRLAGVALIGFGLLVGGWIIRNQVQTGNAVLVTHRGTSLLWKTTHLTRASTAEDYAADGQLAAARDVIVRLDEVRAELATENPGQELPTDGFIAFIALRRELGLSEFEADSLMGDIALENILAHPFYFVVQAPQNIFVFLTGVSRPISFAIDLGLIKAGVSESIAAGSYLYPAANLALRIGTIASFVPLLLYGLYHSWFRFPQARWLTLAFLLSLAYHFLVVVLVTADDRYRIPLHGLMWLYVSIGFVYLPWNRFASALHSLRNWKYAVPKTSRRFLRLRRQNVQVAQDDLIYSGFVGVFHMSEGSYNPFETHPLANCPLRFTKSRYRLHKKLNFFS